MSQKRGRMLKWSLKLLIVSLYGNIYTSECDLSFRSINYKNLDKARVATLMSKLMFSLMQFTLIPTKDMQANI